MKTPEQKLKDKQYYKENKEIFKRRASDRYYKHREVILLKRRQTGESKIKAKQWRIRYPEKVVAYRKIYYEAFGRDYVREYKRKLDVPGKLADRLRSRLYSALKKGDTKPGSHIKLLGCSIIQLKQHLEKQFKPGMNWDNWGKYGWHIDHILPLSSFDLQNKEELKKVCHYSNLQPLWAKENLSKGNRIKEIK